MELASPESLLALRQKKKSSLSHTSGSREPAINELRNRQRKWEKARKERLKWWFSLDDNDGDKIIKSCKHTEERRRNLDSWGP